MATKKGKKKVIAKWNDDDRQAFADRNFLKAQQIPDKRKAKDKRECRDFRWER